MIQRRFVLRPWLVRSLLPVETIGTYVLWDRKAPFYAGRSDTSLQRRLVEHARVHRDTYFTFDVSHTADLAFDMECSLFHALHGRLRNQIHPGRPGYSTATCPFCRDHLLQVRIARLPEALHTSQ
jgi:hypothetical protein